jgi:regulatory protein
VAAEVAAEVLERYSEVGIIDDRAFANAWVTSRHHGKGLARRALAVELRRKGVDDSVVGEALDDLDPGTEAATARALVDRKLRTDRGGPPDAVFRRMVGMLARKGYAPGLAVRVVREALEDARERDALAGDALTGDVGSLDELVDVDVLEAEARAADQDPRDHEP